MYPDGVIALYVDDVLVLGTKDHVSRTKKILGRTRRHQEFSRHKHRSGYTKCILKSTSKNLLEHPMVQPEVAC